MKTFNDIPTPAKALFIRLTLLFCVCYFGVLFLTNPIGTRWVDFQVYWDAGLRALAHATVYDTTVYMQYRYSPFIAMVFGWIFEPLGFAWASWVFQKASLLGWIWLFAVWILDSGAVKAPTLDDLSPSSEPLGPIGGSGNPGGVPLLSSSETSDVPSSTSQSSAPLHVSTLTETDPILTPPRWNDLGPFLFITVLFFGSALRLDLQFGQVNSFTFILLYLGMRWSEEEEKPASRRSWLKLIGSGLALALAIQMKLFCLIALFPLVVKWRIRSGLLTLLFLVLTVYGGTASFHGAAFAQEEILRWFHLLGESTPELMLGLTNINVLGVLGRWTGLPFAKAIWGVSLLAYLAVCWRWRKLDFFPTFALGSAAIYFLHPLTWTYWVLFLIPGFLLALSALQRSTTLRRESLWRWDHLLILPALACFNMQHSHYVKRWPLLVASILAGVWVLHILRRSSDAKKVHIHADELL